MSEDPRAHWDHQAQFYASDEGHQRYRKFLELYETSCWRYIEPSLPAVEGSKILEVGCGTGRWIYRLAPMGYQITLSDLSPEMIQLARERVADLDLEDRVDGFHVLDICDLHPLVDSSFDLVLALGGPLGLADDVLAGVAELHRVTKPGGYIICDVANRYRTGLELMRSGKPEQIVEVLTSGEYARPDGLRDHRFDPQELHMVFQEAGCEVKRIVGICPFFDFLPDTDSVEVLENELMFEVMQDLSKRSEEPAVVGLSGRLLIVAQRRE